MNLNASMTKIMFNIIKRMSKKEHILDWYIENTPSDEREYEKGCVGAAVVIAIIIIALAVGICFIG
jgi:hypothetical protein